MKKENPKNYRKQDFVKMQKNIINLQKGNKVMIKLTLNHIVQKCVENGRDNALHCKYLLDCQGEKILVETLGRAQEKEETLNSLLSVIDSVLRNQFDSQTAEAFQKTDIISSIISLLRTSSPQSKLWCLQIIQKLSSFKSLNKSLSASKVTESLRSEMEKVESISGEITQLEIIAALFGIVQNLGKFEESFGELKKKGIFKEINRLYEMGKDTNYLRDLLIELLESISIHQDTMKLLQIDLADLLENTVMSLNTNQLLKLQNIILKIVTEEQVQQTIQNILKQPQNKDILMIGCVAAHPQYFFLMKNEQLFESCIKEFQKENSPQIVKQGIIKYFMELISLDIQYLNKLETKGAIKSIIHTIQDPSDDEYNFVIQSLLFFKRIIKVRGKDFVKKLFNLNIPQNYSDFLTSLSPFYDKFRIKALNKRKALDSIEFHKGEISRRILMSKKEINQKELVDQELALKYICFEQLTGSLLDFQSNLFTTDPSQDLVLNENFFKTILLIMKAYKNNQKIYESIFQALSKFDYSNEEGTIITDLQYPKIMCEKLWANPEWNYFSLYCLRFMERLVNNPTILTKLQSKLSSVRLVASINNFINEDEFKNFERELEGDTSEKFVDLTFAEEREVRKKSSKLLDRLMDSTVLQTYKDSISKQISMFRPKQDTITVLRSEFAVLAVANGMNSYGYDGLYSDFHQWILKQIDLIEESVQHKSFKNKEKLIGDCISSIANYICITGSIKGKQLYQEKDISRIVFNLLNKYLQQSRNPLQCYCLLSSYKNWLIERIEIIENCTKEDRALIYDPSNFLMITPPDSKKTITEAADVLFEIHQNYTEHDTLIQLNYEVILLLGYLYPQWKHQVGKNFIPIILDSVQNAQKLGDLTFKSIELLKHLTGSDGKSDSYEREIVDFAASKGAIPIITKSIADNGFDQEYINHCKPLLECLASNEDNLDICYEKIDDLLQKLENISSESPSSQVSKIQEIQSINNQLNALAKLKPLRIYLQQNNHMKIIQKIWKNLDDQKDKIGVNDLQNLDNTVSQTSKINLLEAESEEEINDLIGDDQDVIRTCFKILKRNKQNESLVDKNSEILNCFFPGQLSKQVKQIYKSEKFEPDLEKLFNMHMKSKNEKLQNEVTTLYFNLSQSHNEKLADKNINDILREINNAINGKDSQNLGKQWQKLKPYLENEIFQEKYQDYGINDYILKTLKYLEQQTINKTNKNSQENVMDSLGLTSNPDLGVNKKQMMKDEIKVGKNLTDFMINLQKNNKKNMVKNKEIVKETGVLGLLCGSPEIFRLFKDFLRIDQNQEILKKNKTMDCAVYLLLKAYRDDFQIFEKQEEGSLNVSTLKSVSQSVQQQPMKTSQILAHQVKENKGKVLKQKLEDFSMIAGQIADKEYLQDLLEEYKKNLSNYNHEDPQTLHNLMITSRKVNALLNADSGAFLNKDQFKPLKSAFKKFLGALNKERIPSKKLLWFFNRNFNLIAKEAQKNGLNMNSEMIWNQILHRYFVQTPKLAKNEYDLIFENLSLTLPQKDSEKELEAFSEEEYSIFSPKQISSTGILSNDNLNNLPILLDNYHQAILKNDIKEIEALNQLEGMSRSKNFTEKFILSQNFSRFFERFKETAILENPEFFLKNKEILTNVLMTVKRAKKDNDKKLIEVFEKIFEEDLLYHFINALEENRKGVCQASVEFLNDSFDIINNKNIYDQRGVIFTLLNHLKSQKKPQYELMILLCKMSHDQNLIKALQKAQIFEKCQKSLFKTQLTNENFSYFRSVSPIENNDQLQVKFDNYLMAQLSGLEENQKLLCDMKKQDNLIKMYKIYKNVDNVPILACKLLETMKNGFSKLQDKQIKENELEIVKIIKDLPSQVEKFKNFPKTAQKLKNLLELMKEIKERGTPKTLLEKYQDQLKGKNNGINLRDLDSLAAIIEDLKNKILKKPLTKDENYTLNQANEIVQEFLEDKEKTYKMNNKKINTNLRKIVDSSNSQQSDKLPSLKSLQKFVEQDFMNEIMAGDQLQVNGSIKGVKDNLEDDSVLNEETGILGYLSLKKAVGAKISSDSKLVESLLRIVLSTKYSERTKLNALKILKNIVQFQDNQNLEKEILKFSKKLFSVNQKSAHVSAGIIDLHEIMANKNKKYCQQMVLDNILKNIKNLYQIHQDPVLNLPTSKLTYRICDANPKYHDYIMKSSILKQLSIPYCNYSSDQEFHRFVGKLMLQLSFQNQPNKQKICEMGFIKGLVPLLKHYSSSSYQNMPLCSLLLKCMANFSLIPLGIESLMEDEIISCFDQFYENHKEDQHKQNQLVMCTMSNLCYEPNEKTIDEIIEKKGVAFIAKVLDYYVEMSQKEVSEASIDALTHISQTNNALIHIKKNHKETIDTLVDILKQKVSSKMVYKSLRCLTKYCRMKELSDRVLEKGGIAVLMNLFKAYQGDFKNVFQALKLLCLLAKNYPNKKQDFIFAGCPEKVVQNFQLTWPLEIIKKSVELFARMADQENSIKDMLAEHFLDDLMGIMKKEFKDKSMVKNGLQLLSVCSGNVTAVNTIMREKGTVLITNIFNNYISSENMTLNNLFLMENLLLMNENSRNQFLKLKTDKFVKKIYQSTHPEEQKEVHEQAKRVWELLQGGQSRAKGGSLLDVTQTQLIKQKEKKELEELKKILPEKIVDILQKGRVLKVYGEDKVCRSMLFFLSSDFSCFYCKHPHEKTVKMKWIMPISQIKEIKYMYDQDSPIAKAANFFRKAPPKEKCFAIFGPQQKHDFKNFHFYCKDVAEAKNWFEYCSLVFNQYKKAKQKFMNQK